MVHGLHLVTAGFTVLISIDVLRWKARYVSEMYMPDRVLLVAFSRIKEGIDTYLGSTHDNSEFLFTCH